jgi:hypothetical protein
MSFDTAWLDLREPSDRAARNNTLVDRAAALLSEPEALAVDLGAGTGASLRALTAAGASSARWRLIDHDPALLAEACHRHDGVETVSADLRSIGSLPLRGAHLVTAAALMDLVSEPWMARLADRLAAERVPLYASLIYDGSMRFSPEDPADETVREAFNAHQRSDKGFGPALGPTAAPTLATVLKERGFQVAQAASPWHLDARASPQQAALLEAFITGVGEAAACTEGSAGHAWIQRRRAMAHSAACEVGHVDILAVPASVGATTS